MTRVVLFSVVRFIQEDGLQWSEVDWHPTLYPVLDQISPNGEVTDQLVGIGDELIDALGDEVPS